MGGLMGISGGPLIAGSFADGFGVCWDVRAPGRQAIPAGDGRGYLLTHPRTQILELRYSTNWIPT